MRAVYSYCPFDGGELGTIVGLPTCPSCGFVDYLAPKPCVGVLVEHEGAVLLGKKKNGAWDILGGFVEPGETAEEAAAREVREEAGLELTNLQYFMSAVDTYPPQGEPTLTLCFTATTANWPPTAGSDVDEVRAFSPENLPNDLAFPHQRNVMNVWRHTASSLSRSRLLEEYRQCQSGYQYRDAMTQDEFVKIVQLFSVLFALLAATSFLGAIHLWLLFAIRLTLCAAGTLGILALLIDLEANASCKGALRKRGVTLERLLGIEYWTWIGGRRMFAEESYAKRFLAWVENWGQRRCVGEGSVTTVFVCVGRVLCLMWFVASMAAALIGPTLLVP
jgi:ADP-ribose pyrophosphatase YjhB (NUDIX family)